MSRSFTIIDKFDERKAGYLLDHLKVSKLLKRRRNNTTYEYWTLELKYSYWSYSQLKHVLTTEHNKYFYNGAQWTICSGRGYFIYRKTYEELMESRRLYLIQYSIDKVYHVMRSLGILPRELYIEIAAITLLTFKFSG